MNLEFPIAVVEKYLASKCKALIHSLKVLFKILRTSYSFHKGAEQSWQWFRCNFPGRSLCTDSLRSFLVTCLAVEAGSWRYWTMLDLWTRFSPVFFCSLNVRSRISSASALYRMGMKLKFAVDTVVQFPILYVVYIVPFNVLGYLQ